MNKKNSFVLFLTFLLVPSTVFAETIILKSGKTVEGKILERTDKSIKIDVAGVGISYYFDEIEKIDGKNISAFNDTENTLSTKPKTASDIFQNVSPAVVYITTNAASGERSLGSGFIVDKNGTIVTNYHVVRGANEIKVRLKNGKSYSAETVIYYNSLWDICIFTISAKNLPTVPLGSTKTLKIGDKIYCIGNPFGFDYSLSDGMISGIRYDNGIKHLQFTAPISPGNSGGPLIDSHGSVIGLVSFYRVGGQNLNFALDVEEVKRFIRTTHNIPFRVFAEKAPAADKYIIDANQYYAQGNYASAIPLYEKAIDIDPNNDMAYFRLALSYNYNGNYDKAIAVFNKEIELYPENYNIYDVQSMSYENKGDFDNAIANSNKALQLNPDDEYAYNNRGTAYLSKGDVDRAIADYDKAAEINPNLSLIYHNRARAYFNKKDYDKCWDDVYKVKALGGKVEPNFIEKLKRVSGKSN